MKGTAVLRRRNEKRILSHLRRYLASSRQELAERLGLGKNTVSVIVDGFLRQGLVVERGPDGGGVGRPRIEVALNTQALLAIGILIRDSDYEVVVMDYVGQPLEIQRVAVAAQSPDCCLAVVGQHCQRLVQAYPNLVGIGVAVPGLVNPLTGVVHSSTHLGWREVPVADILRKFIPGLPILVWNRVKAAALSPLRAVPGEATSTFYVRIDEGVGGAFVVGADVVQGSAWTAGEIGHIAVQPNGPVCKCGQRGCLEALVSLPALALRLFAAAADGRLSISPDGLVHRPESVTRAVWETTLAEMGAEVGAALAIVVNLLNPEYVMMDSPYGHESAFCTALLAAVEHRALPLPVARTHFRFASVPHASPLGAAQAIILQYEHSE